MYASSAGPIKHQLIRVRSPLQRRLAGGATSPDDSSSHSPAPAVARRNLQLDRDPLQLSHASPNSRYTFNGIDTKKMQRSLPRSPRLIALALCTITLVAGALIYYFLLYTPPYVPRIVGDSQFDMSTCLAEVQNVTQTYNRQHGILSMHDLQQGIHHATAEQLQNARSKQPLSYYGIGEAGSAERERWDSRPTKMHILWEDPVRKCPCYQCMHKLVVLIRSMLATQNLEQVGIMLWASNPAELYDSSILATVLPWVLIQLYDPFELAKGTFLEGMELLKTADERVYVQGDLFRWLVLYVHGGVYVDADSILLNDFTPLIADGREFWSRWACTDYMSPGIMSLQKGGKIAEEILTLLTQTDPAAGGYVWGRGTMTPWYNAKIKKIETQGKLDDDEAPIPFVTPACYFYPQWCAEEFHNYFDAASDAESNPPPLFLHGFAYHWHGGGGKRFERSYDRNSQFDLTERYVNKLLQVKFGSRTAADLQLIDHYQSQAHTLTPLQRTQTLGSAAVQQWDTEHWNVTGFDRYATPETCDAGSYDVTKMLMVAAASVGVVAVGLLVLQFACRSCGGVKGVFQAVYRSASATLTSLLGIVMLIADTIGGLLYAALTTLTTCGRRSYSQYSQLATNAPHTNASAARIQKTQQRVLVLATAAVIALTVVVIIRSLKSHDCGFGAGGEYSIGIYLGAAALKVNQLAASMASVNNPVISRRQITDRNTKFVADPFLVPPSVNVGDVSHWHLFFEVQPAGSNEPGCLAVATSTNAVNWQYTGVVLDEPYHLSYPYVFREHEDAGAYYMIPETGRRGQVQLYQALDYPHTWVLSSVLLDGGQQWLDPSIFYYKKRWYMFVVVGGVDDLRLFHSTTLHSGWQEHPRSPVVKGDKSSTRPAGRVVEVEDADGDHLLRFAQDNTREYGEAVKAFRITKLSPTVYAEQSALPQQPLLQGSSKLPVSADHIQSNWNSNNMHHIDLHESQDDKYVAAVDGCGTW